MPHRRSRTVSLLASALMFAFTAWALARGDDGLDLPIEKPELAPVHTRTLPTVVQAPLAPHPCAPLPPHDPPPTFFGRDLDARRSLIYVIDTSESMKMTTSGGEDQGGEDPNSRLGLAKAQLRKSIKALPKSFKFDVIHYDCSLYTLWGALREATDANRAEADHWVSMIHAGGATGTGPAVSAALAEDPENKFVVLLTDGDPNCGVMDPTGDDETRREHLAMILQHNTQGARVDVFGIQAQGVFKQFCLDLTSRTGGTYTDVR